MDLQTPLQELVALVPGAVGAILIDNQGDAVTYFAATTNEKERLRLVGAYHRIWLNDCLHMIQKIRLGSLTHLIQKYDYGIVLIKPLPDHHALVLLTNDETYIGQGLWRLTECAELIEGDFQ